VSDLTLDKLILSGAARAKLRALRAADIVFNLCGKNLASQSVVSAAYFVDTVPRSEKSRQAVLMRKFRLTTSLNWLTNDARHREFNHPSISGGLR